VIEKIYKTEGDRVQANRIVHFIEKTGNKDTTKISVWDSLWRDERFARATLVNIVNMTFHVLSGYASIMSYSNTIFKEARKENKDGTYSGLPPRVGTYMMAVIALISAMTAIFSVRTFGRRTLHIVGHSLMALLHFGIAFTIYMGFSTMQIVLVCIFVSVYLNTAGPCGWTYASETCTDTGLALVVLTYYFWETVATFTTEALMEELPVVTFILYGFISSIAVVFICIFMGETKNLSEKEKKEIFMPGAVYGRKLHPTEMPFRELGQEHKSRATLRSEMLQLRPSI